MMNTLTKILVFVDLMEEMVAEEQLPECANVTTVVMNRLKHAVPHVEIKNALNVIHHYAEQTNTSIKQFHLLL